MRSLVAVVAALLAIPGCRPDTPPPDAAPTAEFASDRITVVTRGTGPDLILVPGLASHRDVFAGVADSLDDRYRLHLVQVNGFAGLPPGPNVSGPVSAPVTEEIARYIREMELDRPTFIGHSMGGTIGMMLAARHPETVGRLMIVDVVPYLGAVFSPPGSTPEQVQQNADELRGRIMADSAGAMLEQMFSEMTRTDALRPMLLEGVRGTDRQTAANAMHELIVTDLRPELARITVPVTVLYVVPTNVPLTPEQFDNSMRESYANVPHARLIRVDHSNHFIMFDQPARVIAEVDTLLRQNSPARN